MTPLLLALAIAAPAPKPRPPPAPADLVGRWRQTWYGTTESALYRADGTCSYYWRGEYREGTWRLEGATLEVVTWRANDPPDAPNAPLTYRYDVARTRRGVWCANWRLER